MIILLSLFCKLSCTFGRAAVVASVVVCLYSITLEDPLFSVDRKYVFIPWRRQREEDQDKIQKREDLNAKKWNNLREG